MSCIRILGEDDVRAAIDSERALDLARRTLKDQAQGNSMLSTPSSMSLDARRFGAGRFKFKAASVGHLGASGIRLISRMSATDPDAFNYSAVYQHDGLALSGLVPELWISRIRTAAFGAATIESLVNRGPLIVALFGTGKIANEIVPMLARTLDISEFRVNSRRTESMSAFVAAHAPKLVFDMHVEPDKAGAVHDANLIITLTDSTAPLVLPRTVKAGAVVCSMGGGNEIDHGVLAECQRLIVDDADFASEVGDGGAWISQGRLSREAFSSRIDALACDVVAGKKSGRDSKADRILALIQGMAIGDIAFAAYALQEATKRGRGKLVELP